MSTFTTQDGTQIYYKDWGSGPVVSFSHGWPLNADAWEAQMFFLASNGYRCIAHDRRGHGRSSQPWSGNDMNTYADDLNELFTALELKSVTMVGHSTGGGEVARYIGRHGTRRVARAVLMGAVPPSHGQDRCQPGWFADRGLRRLPQGLPGRPLAVLSRCGQRPVLRLQPARLRRSRKGLIQSWWMQGMMSGHKNAYDCIQAFSETDFTADLKKFDVPTLIIHGDDDQIVPIGASAMLSSKLVKNATLKVYPSGSHSLGDTSKDKLNADLLAFLKS